ncbi:MAG: M3 family oligoendopeptidase [Candidatus Riflebacteria bacterium]|nr:M3 family oligoendopeptidase [Candidatus Riflebacteria bacterium]
MQSGTTWDLTPFFPTFDGPEMKTFRQAIEKDLADLTIMAGGLDPLNNRNQIPWEEVFVRTEKLMTRLVHYGVFVSCLASADARNEAYQAANAAMAGLEAQFAKLDVEMKRGLKTAKDKDFDKFLARKELSTIAYFLHRVREEAQKTMAPELEILNADLGIDGISAWGRLYNTVAGKLEFDMTFPDGRRERLPMSQRRSLMEDVDRRVRQAAFRQGNEAWGTMADVTAAAINHIAGTRLLLNKRRGVDHFLDVALFQARISRGTLDAMFQAIETCKPLIQRIGRAKAKALGLPALAWYDLDAPLPLPDSRRFTWEEGVKLVEGAFQRTFPELAEYFRTALAKRWIESEPRPGKRPGAYCTGSTLIEQSRVFMTFTGSLGDVQTLAHEIGHAFHSHVMQGQREFARGYPMTLAESASTFAEMILTDGILADPQIPEAQKANVLSTTLSHALAFLCDIPVRFLFEKAFHEERQQGEVSVTRLKELMAGTQRQVFGDLLAPDGEDPLFWASKLHFYITEVTFYNFPYTFGFLLSRGLYSLFRKQGGAFLDKYKSFLRFSGNASAEEVARASIGVDLTSPAFWVDSIRSLEPDLAQFEELLPRVLPGGH